MANAHIVILRAILVACVVMAGSLGVSQPQAVVAQAESLAGPWRQQTNIPGYLGAGFRTSNVLGKPAEEPLRGEVQIPSTGRWAIWARGYEGDGQDRRFQVRIAGQLLPPTHASHTGERFTWQKAGEVELSAGPAEILVIDAGDGYETADAVLLTQDLSYDPAAEEGLLKVYEDPEAAHRVALDYVVETVKAQRLARPLPATVQEWESQRPALRQRLLESLGLNPLPPRTPLNARIVRVVERGDYEIEHLVFESHPGFLVTANVYRPTQIAGRLPAVVCPTGHWQHAKMEPVVQSRCIGLAKLGFVALVYDPFGQGERAVPGNEHGQNLRAVLVGRCNLSYMVWDTMRAIDYLETRPDVDASRIGVTGASGGGLNTLYASAIDERIAVSVPVAYYFEFGEFLSLGAWHCPCNHVPGVLSFADTTRLAALIAPRPLMIVCGTRDALFPIEGARQAFREVQQIYRLYGAEDRVHLLEVDAPHDYNQPMREGMYGWMSRWLKDAPTDLPVPEPEMKTEPAPFTDLLCFPSGHVPEGTVSVLQMLKAEAEAAGAMLPAPGALGGEETRQQLRERLGLDAAAAHHDLMTVRRGEVGGALAIVAKVQTDEFTAIPAVLFPAPSGKAPLLIYVSQGETAVSVAGDLAPEVRDAGMNLLWVDPRGWGETEYDNWVIGFDGILLGQPIMGQRVRDVLAAIEAFREYPSVDSRRLLIWGRGMEAGPVALYCAAITPGFRAVIAEGTLGSYLDLFVLKGEYIPPSLAIPNVLRVADIAQTAVLALPGRVLLTTIPEADPRHTEPWRSWLGQHGVQFDYDKTLTQEEAVDWLAGSVQ